MIGPQSETPQPEKPAKKQDKVRSGYLTAYLIFQLVLFATGVFLGSVYSIQESFIASLVKLPVWTVPVISLPGWYYPVLALASIWAVICTIALFKWKRWGFWGFGVVGVALFVVYAILHLLQYCFASLLGVIILFVMLNVGEENQKGWPQLD